MSCGHWRYLEAVLDQEVVLPAGGPSFGIILQQDKELFGQLVGVLLHSWKRELQQPREGHQRLRDHLSVRVENELLHRQSVRPERCRQKEKHRTFTCMELRQSSSSGTKGSSISRTEVSDDVTLDFFRLRWRS